jgi:multidrug efflux pump
MLSKFFIDRPIFATVLSVVITLAGFIAMVNLPIAQYPRITPPAVNVTITYPGASAQVVADTVAAPIEQQVTGVPGMLYMSSQMGNDGSYSLSMTFDVSVDLNTALVMVQNRVALALPLLPTPVQNQGITIRKKTPDILCMVNFLWDGPPAPDMDIYLSNYALINVKDELLRVDGVSDITIMGERDYSIRAWLDPQKLASRSMTAIDVATAISQQNIEAAPGAVGKPPASRVDAFQLPIDTLGRLSDPKQFEEIIIKVGGTTPAKKASGAKTASSAPSGSSTQPAIMPSNTQGGTSGGVMAGTTGTTGQGSTSTSGGTTGGGTTGGSSTGGGTTAGSTTSGGGTIASTTTGGATTGGGGTTSGGASTGGGATLGSGATTPSKGAKGGAATPKAVTAAGNSGPPAAPSNSVVRLRDVGRVEMGALNYNQFCTFDGQPAVGLSVYQLPGTNALDVADSVRAKMEELKTRFPPGVRYTIAYDITPFIRESVDEVFNTLRDAVILVAIVVLVFLQDWRAMVLPMIDVPVSLIGTFAVMAAVGYSLNNISLFGLVLAIGIVVDDAIVVLENIERQLAKGYDTRTATIKAMEEISGPIMAITLVLCAVFVPCAFISGITGRFFRQFAVTISASTVISAINALTMTPSRALVIFKTKEGHQHKPEALPWWIFGLCGLLTIRYCQEFFADQLGLPEVTGGEEGLPVPAWKVWAVNAVSFAPGMVAGLVLGWFIIRPVNAILGFLFRGFNRGFDAMTAVYGWTIGMMLRACVAVLLFYGGLLFLTYWVYQDAPTGFVPQQDMGRIIVSVQLPDSASLMRTQDAMQQVDKIMRETPGVAHTIGLGGISFVEQANAPNFGSFFVILKPFAERREPGLKDEAIMAKLRKRWAKEVKDATVVVAGSSPIPGLSVSGGFKIIVEDRGGLGLATLQDQADKLIQKIKGDSYKLTEKTFGSLTAGGLPETVLQKLAPFKNEQFNQQSLKKMLATTLDDGERQKYEPVILIQARQAVLGLAGVATQFRSNTPQLFMDIDRNKVASLGVSLDDVNQTLEIYLGSLYVNSFNEFGRHWQVTVQADRDFRYKVDDIQLLQVRNKQGQMVPIATLVDVQEINGPIFVKRYNLSTAAPISGSLLPGVSSGNVINGVDKLSLENLPRSMKTEWTELMFMQIKEGNTTGIVFALAVVAVFLALSALYESWTLPLAVILVVPLCALCSLTGGLIMNVSLNIFVQIGLVVLVGLACKNAILVVEFAKHLHVEGGRSVFEATKEASRLRLRPILMTSFAFILGVSPLCVAAGAGAEMRRSLGIAVFSGMLGVTVFGIFLTPVFFYVIQGLGETWAFTAGPVRWIGSCVLGAAVGAGTGYLMAKLGVFVMPWAAIVGGLAGVLGALAVLGVHQTLRTWK